MQHHAVLNGAAGASGYLRPADGSGCYAVHVSTAEDGRPLTLSACPALTAALAGQEEAIKQRLARSADANAFLGELSELLERPVAPAAIGASAQGPAGSDSQLGALPAPDFYRRILSELDAIGWSAVVGVSAALRELELRVEDATGREHLLGLALPPEYPHAPPTVRATLPSPFEVRWPVDAASGLAVHALETALAQFRVALTRHQRLWDLLDDLDAHTWVLEPRAPRRDSVSRRLALGNHCSLQVELHVGAPTSLPEVQFLGAERHIAPLRLALNANLARWQPDEGVRHNLERVLQLRFPAREQHAAAAAEYAVECAICYMYELDGCVPESACDSCSKPFHKACLAEWLRGLSTTQQSFNRLFGARARTNQPPPPGPCAAHRASGHDQRLAHRSAHTHMYPCPPQASAHTAALQSPSKWSRASDFGSPVGRCVCSL